MEPLQERSLPGVHHTKTKLRLVYWMEVIKSTARSRLEKMPFLGFKLVLLWRKSRDTYRSQMLRLSTWRKRYLDSSGLLPEEEINLTHYVSPKDITYSSLVEYSFTDGKGLILDGDWDRLDKKFDDLDVYVAFGEVIRKGKSWKETVFYQRTLAKLENGETLWGCANKRDFDARCLEFNTLIEDIKTDGYKSQKELDTGDLDDEIIVNIGRFGDLLFSNSAHRLAIAKILDIERIPVKIAVRHTEWMRFRSVYRKFAVDREAKAYQPALHPDLDHIPAHHDCEDRFEVIKKNLSARQGRVLDIGANLGYFSSKFEDEGFKCVAVESDPSYVYCLKGLRRATNKHYRIIEGSILESSEVLGEPFDVVLALNIFHHFLKSKEIFEKFEHFIGRLNCREIYFEPHLYNESQMVNAYRNWQPDEFAEYIRLKTKLTKSVLIGYASDDRPLYKIS